MRSSVVPKKYKYEYESLDINTGVNFLKSQIDDIKKFKTELLMKYKNHLGETPNNVEALTIINDIETFLNEKRVVEESLYKAYNRTSKGAYGEDKVREIVYTFENEWKVLGNANLNIEGNKIENDFIIVDESGITTIEVKNIGNQSEKLIIDSLGRVSRINRNNQEIETYDMIAQSNRHLAYIKKYIDNKLNFDVPVNYLIVIASNIKIKNNSNFKVIGINQIYNVIKDQDKLLNKEEVNLTYETLYDSLTDGTKYPYIDYLSVLDKNYNLILKSIKEFLVG